MLQNTPTFRDHLSTIPSNRSAGPLHDIQGPSTDHDTSVDNLSSTEPIRKDIIFIEEFSFALHDLSLEFGVKTVDNIIYKLHSNEFDFDTFRGKIRNVRDCRLLSEVRYRRVFVNDGF